MLQCVRMALSGVARTQGRVGKGLVAKMLCGSHSQQLRKLRLDQLSTFGLLSHLCQSEANTLLDALIETKLIEQTETQRFRPTVKLTSRGRQVMTGQLQLDRPLPVSAHLRRKLQQVPVSKPVTSAARGSDRVSRCGADSEPVPPAAGADRAAAGADRADGATGQLVSRIWQRVPTSSGRGASSTRDVHSPNVRGSGGWTRPPWCGISCWPPRRGIQCARPMSSRRTSFCNWRVRRRRTITTTTARKVDSRPS